MKNTILLTALLLMAEVLVAQDGLHLTLGGNSSRFQSEVTPFDSKYGYQLGIEYTDVYSQGFDFSTGIRYITRGANFANQNLNYGYLDAMVTLGYRPLKPMRLYGGAHISALVQSPEFLDPSGLDAGLLLGLRFDLDKIFFSTTYQHGLARISGFDDGVSSRGVELGVGFLLDLSPAPKVPTETVIIRPSKIETVDIVQKQPEPQQVQDTTTQPYTHEVAVRAVGFDRFDFIYKERVRANRYNRLSLMALSLATEPGDDDLELGVGVSFGPEYRRQLDRSTYMVHGPQLEFALLYSRFGNSNNLLLRPGLGYLIGIHHSLSERFSVGLELVPVVRYQHLENTTTGETSSNVAVDFTTQNTAIVVSYRFGGSQ